MTALLTCPTIQAASEASGIPVRTLYDMRTDPDFRAEYEQRRRQLTEDACTALQGRMTDAVEIIAALMTGSKTPPRVRLDAAKAILEYGLKSLETLDILPRLEALEDAENRRNSPRGG
jgi:hypothetical protein